MEEEEQSKAKLGGESQTQTESQNAGAVSVPTKDAKREIDFVRVAKETTGTANNSPPPNTSIRSLGPNASAGPTAQLTIFYSGTVSVFDAVPVEKAQAIMFVAATAAAAAVTANKNTENGAIHSAVAPPVLTRSPSLQSTAGIVSASPNLLQSMQSTSLCKLQAELPIARRHSLQRFLEKRRDRLVSKSPYPPSTPTRVTNSKESNYSAEASMQTGCFTENAKSQDEALPTVSAHIAAV